MNEIICGDCCDIMRGMDAGSVNCCVTSPPYWGLRDYGVDGQLGLESTPDEFVAKMVAVFAEVKRVLRDDGPLWLNLGDSYAGTGPISQKQTEADRRHATVAGTLSGAQRRVGIVDGLKPKDLCGIPWRVAFALQADGWYLRQDIIWHKPNPMPESVTDRCTKSHEYIFLLSKSKKYYYDAEAIKEPCIESNASRPRMGQGPNTKYNQKRRDQDFAGKGSIHSGESHMGRGESTRRFGNDPETRNKRSVWTVPTAPYKEAHFATFPPKLIEPCILAGCPVDGVVLDPFMGSGTVAAVAYQNSRNYVGCELNPKYVTLANKRIDAEKSKYSLIEL